MKKILFLAAALLMSAAVLAQPECKDGSGSIWTTDLNCGTQDANHYAVGDEIWLAGEGFCPYVEYNWSFTGLPGGASCTPDMEVAGGIFNQVKEDGSFCLALHTVAENECGEYKVDFNGKKDNYRVDESDIPEFSLIAGGLALVGASIGYAYVRKR